MEAELIRCSRCYKQFYADGFKISRLGIRLKTCLECGIRRKLENEKYKCPHGKRKSECQECGGIGLCEHRKRRSQCKECEGASICIHKIVRSQCKECTPNGHLRKVVADRMNKALGADKNRDVLGCLGCSIIEFRTHIETTFEVGMNWNNYGLGIGKWSIDHSIPLGFLTNGVAPTTEEVITRLHYTNTQALWAVDNSKKGNKFIGKQQE